MSTEVREPSAKYFVEVPYKQTDIGEIPSDWLITSLREATDAARPISYGIVQTGPNIDGGVPCIRVVDIDNGRLNTTGLICTSQAISAGYRRTLLQTGDLVMPLRGKVGDVAEVGPELEGANLTRGVALLSIRSGIVGSYCRQALAWSTTRRRLEQAMNGSALQEIPIAALRSFQIALPKEEREQRAIATALSDVDALIDGLGKLIAKKRDLKQAAMQQLLTGQTRLPGFSGEWHQGVFGDVVTALEAGVSVNSIDTEPTIDTPCVLKTSALVGGRFLPNEAKVIEPRDIGRARTCAKGDTILISRMNTPMLVGEVAYVARDFDSLYLPDRVWMARFNASKNVNVRWMAFLLSSQRYRELLRDVATGTSGSMKNISKGALRSLPIQFPSPKEQTAIATVLSYMDADLAALESQLTKTRDLKQGMMQELLTGRTRLL